LYLGSILSVYKSAAKIKEVGSLSAELLDIARGFYKIIVTVSIKTIWKISSAAFINVNAIKKQGSTLLTR
jgi:hypothetical protein